MLIPAYSLRGRYNRNGSLKNQEGVNKKNVFFIHALCQVFSWVPV